MSRLIEAVMAERRTQHVQPQQISIPGPAPGSEVEVTGLVKRPELNGVRGRVVRRIPGTDRWQVKLKDGHGKASLKVVNLRVV